ncbi:crotonobetainyl-CoA:carnitine CoA-transferase CaiB-like acyl-CoA transferase [Micromonospora palomenae]|uniref:Crotonobetainyl-CoA:carnitine CoA-transferase CaiB-like acyl-CoA transferase n=1 Tax=Micromonospora palomenae TaxID=1461247 RepID=A0A561WV87_9ACTN|nr:CoA transferase [Micromonospora palomenae]TWG27751.1 crotonobetainyl-CoA:carnitine CoA-transferase CaiB-like acyl-CoA transferase [Micromonospora palomenae]
MAEQRAGPLDGVLVADFSRILAGPYATMLLADLGAEVIKVEGPGGDDTRAWTPPAREGVSTYYLGVNRNKRSIALDLADPDDLAVARELARRADVMIENFRPGGLRRFGLDYDSVAAGNDRIVYASVSGFGADAGAHLPGYDLMVQAASGLMSLTGDADGPPYKAGVAVFDVIAGLHAAVGILAALHHRARTGVGQHVEVNLLSSALSGLVNHTSGYVAGGAAPYRMGNAHPSLFPYEPLPTADGDLVVIAGNDGQFRRLCQVLGLPQLADDPRFGRNQDRTVHRDALRPLLVARLARRTRDEWFRDLTAAGVPCAPITTVDGGVALAEQLGLDPVVTVNGVPGARHPIGFSETPPRYDLPPPGLDEHGDDIRAWLTATTGATEHDETARSTRPA